LGFIISYSLHPVWGNKTCTRVYKVCYRGKKVAGEWRRGRGGEGSGAANGALALLAVACSLLDRQIATLEKNFVEEGGFTERLYRVRSERRTRQ
jgi:four helix bundle suffix protein